MRLSLASLEQEIALLSLFSTWTKNLLPHSYELADLAPLEKV
jgi:hypothetical protein